MKIEISICTGLMLNDHSNPYIESTTLLSDYVCTGVREGQRLERVANMVIIFIVINNN